MSKVWVTKTPGGLYMLWNNLSSIGDSGRSLSYYTENWLQELYPGTPLPTGNQIVEVKISGKVVEG